MVGKRIREERKARGLSQQALAVAVGVDKSTVARWEQEKGDTTVGILEKVARALQCSPAVFFEDMPGYLALAV